MFEVLEGVLLILAGDKTCKQTCTLAAWSRTTVENCIGGHVNVLSDYKKT